MIWNRDLKDYKAPTSALTILGRFAAAILITIILGMEIQF